MCWMEWVEVKRKGRIFSRVKFFVNVQRGLESDRCALSGSPSEQRNAPCIQMLLAAAVDWNRHVCVLYLYSAAVQECFLMNHISSHVLFENIWKSGNRKWAGSEEYRPPLWSSGQNSWLQIQRTRFDSRRYQIFWEIVVWNGFHSASWG
jgi:hypothetical protein